MRPIYKIASSLIRRIQRNRVNSDFSLSQSVGAMLMLFVALTINASVTAETLITNTATANYSINGVDKNKSNSVQFTTDDVVIATGITLQKKSNLTQAIVGQTISYTLTVTNNANSIQNNVSIEDLLPTGLEYQENSAKLNSTSIASNNISISDNDIEFTLGDMPANAVWTITYQAKVTATTPLGSAINQAIATSDTAESSPAQAVVNIYEQVIVVPVIPTEPLVIEKQVNQATAKVGDTVEYTISLKNPNAKSIPSVTLNDVLPLGMTYKAGSATLNSNAITADTSSGLSFNLGSMPSNSEWTIRYETMVNNEVTARDLVNSVSATSSDTEANSNSSTALVNIINDTIQLTKTVNQETVYIGEMVTYEVVVSNPALHDLTDLVVLDTLPTGFEYQSGSFTLDKQPLSDSEISYSGNNLSINIDTLAEGKSITLGYQVLVTDTSESGNVVNQVQANSTFGTSDIASATVNVRTPSTINFLKIDEAGDIESLPSSSYNADQNGGKNWQLIDEITLPNGSVINLPNPQPILDAEEYSVSEPVIIEVIDKDQNLNSELQETIIVTVTIPGTNDTEVLLLTETSPDSGIFRGAVLTTAETTLKQNGVLTIADGVTISVSYMDEDDNTDTSATAALVVPDTKLSLSKTVDKSSAAIGELVKYTLEFTNTTGFNLTDIKLSDLLPIGFRYVSNTAYLNGEKLTTGVSANGRSLKFTVDNMTAGSSATLEYITKITAGVQTGKAWNTAVLTSGDLTSNTARVSIEIDDDLMRTKNILTGRVYIGCETKATSAKDKSTPRVLKDARIYLETGRSVLTDKEGFWHMEGVLPGSHVLQLDEDSLPKGYTPLLCEDNTRHAGDAKSQFVNLTAGSLWQVNFHVKAGLASELIDDKTDTKASKNNKKTANPAELFDNTYLKSAEPGFEILWPKNRYVPDVASTKVFIKSSPQEKIELFLNGKKISALNYDGSDTNKDRTVKISRWLGIDIDTSIKNNVLLVIAKDKSGKVVARQTRNIHFSSTPASAKFLPDESILVADGKTTPVIALQIKDEDGYPMRANTHGYLTLENSNYQIKTQKDDEEETLDLNESLAGNYKYIVEENGIARIELNPTTQSGEVRFTVNFTDSQSKTISAWLKPQLRDWILVGIAEGTLAHKTITGNMQTLEALGKSDEYYKRGRFAFFAKGQVKGKYLITAAYDTHKADSEVGSQLAGSIDPDEWYSIYADNSTSQYDAPSSTKLYLKIEKDNFYALFGDYQTAMTVTDLASYERVLNGIKTEYRGERFTVKGFISETSNNHQIDEIQGDGTSGLYYLSADIIANSETIKIETRDRYHSDRIIETKQLTRYQDYSIDYDAGTLFFKSPITSRDSNFNPNIIVIDYDSEEDSNKTIVAGGRVSMKSFNDKLETGASVIYEENNNGKDDQLIAADATFKITSNTELHIEVAESQSTESDFEKRQAMIIELEKEVEQMEARLYAKKYDEDFGLSSQSTESGTEKIGAEVTYRINDKTKINSQILYENNLESDNKRKLAEVGVTHRFKNIELNAGLRHTQENLSSSDDDSNDETDSSTLETIKTNTVILGGRYTTKNDKITLRADLEKNFSSDDGSELSPDRFVVGVDVKLQQGFTVFAENETTDNGEVKTHNNRVGIYKDLWKDAKGKTTYTQERTAEGQRNYATLGLSQKLKLTDKISADFSVDRAVTVGDQITFDEDETSIQGTDSDDYTAFSVGLGANEKDWSWTSRAEYRNGKINDKVNFLASVIRHLDDGKQLSAKISFYDQDSTEGDSDTNIKLSLGSAWHPKDESFVFFSRLDLSTEKEISTEESDEFSSTNTDTRKVVHNMHFNKIFNKDAKKKLQVSIHHGIKHVKDETDGVKYSTTVDTATIEVRKDINKRWDVGAHAGYLHDWKGNTMETVAGVSVGVTPAKNTWIEVGYNFEGFDDDDFDDSNFKRKGPYLDFRYKFNQDSLNLNKSRFHRKENKENVLEAE